MGRAVKRLGSWRESRSVESDRYNAEKSDGDPTVIRVPPIIFSFGILFWKISSAVCSRSFQSTRSLLLSNLIF